MTRLFATLAIIATLSAQSCLVFAQDNDPAAAQSEPGASQVQEQKRPAFRGTPVDVQAVEQAINEKLASQETTTEEPVRLSDEKELASRELKRGRQTLEAVTRKASNLAVRGTPEQKEVAEQEVANLQARVRTMEDRVKQIDTEIQGEARDLQNPESAEDTAILPGENIEVYVVEDSTFNGRYQVRRGGYVILPQLGRVYVAGKKINQAEAALKKVLQSSQLRTATVMIERLEGSDVETGPVVYLAGEFKHPRPYKIPMGTAPTLVSIYLGSGGGTERADLTAVKVMRVAAMKGVVEQVNLQQILDGGGLTSDVRLNDGDVVTIPSTSANVVYVTGNVKKQGSFQLHPGETLTAYACILQSGGFARFANLRKTHILRAPPDGTKTKIPLNVIAIQRGEQPDVPLTGNDIIVVPEKFFSI